jgi:hypothetical protein
MRQYIDLIREFAETSEEPEVDIAAFHHPSFLIVEPKTEAGENWLLQYTDEYDPLEGRLYVEHRYGPDLLLGAHQDGLVVSLDGRIADAEL